MIAANTGQRLFFEGAIDAKRFEVFLKDLIGDAEREGFQIVNSLHGRRADCVHEWGAGNVQNIEVIYLPPYAPELNSDENLSGDLTAAICSRLIAKTAPAAPTCVQRILARSNRVRSCCSHKYVRNL